MTHTPGPWIVRNKEKLDDNPVVSRLGDYAICEVFYQRGMLQSAAFDADANARLIAAAPDMLAALERAHLAIQMLPVNALGMVNLVDNNGQPYQYPHRNELLSEIAQAIIKARGE